jgi:hypothetical protein
MKRPRAGSSQRVASFLTVLGLSLVAVLTSCAPSGPDSSATTKTPAQPPVPQMARPDVFKVELFSDLRQFGRLKAFQLTISAGEQGFPPGLYVTSGPSKDDRSDRIVRLDGKGQASIVASGLMSNEAMVFARGAYGSGMLVAEPLRSRIVRVMPDGKVSEFSKTGTAPFGAAGLFYDASGQLLVTDFSGSGVVKVSADGSSELFARLPRPRVPSGYLEGFKGGGGSSGGGGSTEPFLVGLFTTGAQARGLGEIFEISNDGVVLRTRRTGIDSVELVAPSPGGDYGPGIFVPSVGGAGNADGGLYILDSGDRLVPFMTNVDAASVAFDTKNVLGEGMFVADINDNKGAGLVWRVTRR